MTDWELILTILKDQKWHHVQAIMERGKPGSVNWAIRSRIADLKKTGYIIDKRRSSDGQAEYRLISCPVVQRPVRTEQMKGFSYFIEGRFAYFRYYNKSIRIALYEWQEKDKDINWALRLVKKDGATGRKVIC